MTKATLRQKGAALAALQCVVIPLLIMFPLVSSAAEEVSTDDDFQPKKYSASNEVRLAHDYPHLGLRLQEQDNTFLSKEESSEDYAISLVVFPAILAGVCLIAVLCFSLCVLCRCCLLGCINFWKIIFRCCNKDCCRANKKKRDQHEKRVQEMYKIYSKSFLFFILCSVFFIAWVFQGATLVGDGVSETQLAMTKFGNIVSAISNELNGMVLSGFEVDTFLANNTCPDDVSSYLNDIQNNLDLFLDATSTAARITNATAPAIDTANDKLGASWVEAQSTAFNTSAGVLLIVVGVYILGVVLKTAILMRVGLLLTVISSFILCILVFIEMVMVMGYSDFCYEPTYHIERSLRGDAYDIVHYYTSCEGDGPLYQPIEDTDFYNGVMNSTYFDMLLENPSLESSCKEGASTMEDDFSKISAHVLNIIEFARCPYINELYTNLVLDSFCTSSHAGFYNIHVSHLSTLIVFFFLMVNAALLYPHYKGKTLRHICFCCYKKEQSDVADEEDEKGHELFEDIYGALDSDSDTAHDEDSEYEVQRGVCPIPSVDPDSKEVEMVVHKDPENGEEFTYNVNPAYKGPAYVLGEDDEVDDNDQENFESYY